MAHAGIAAGFSVAYDSVIGGKKKTCGGSGLFIKFTSCPRALASLRDGVTEDVKGDESGEDEYEWGYTRTRFVAEIPCAFSQSAYQGWGGFIRHFTLTVNIAPLTFPPFFNLSTSPHLLLPFCPSLSHTDKMILSRPSQIDLVHLDMRIRAAIEEIPRKQNNHRSEDADDMTLDLQLPPVNYPLESPSYMAATDTRISFLESELRAMWKVTRRLSAE
jgi:hypothetical protein